MQRHPPTSPISKAAGAIIALALAAAVCAPPRRASAQEPVDRLLQLAPSDAGACLVLDDLKGAAEYVRQSPTFERWRRWPLLALWKQSPAFRELQQAESAIAQQLGITYDELRDDLLGEALVVCLWPATSADPAGLDYLVLVTPRDPQLLSATLDRLDRAQRQSGELAGELNRVVHGKADYAHKRIGRGPFQWDEYYATLGSAAAYTNRRAAIETVLDLSGPASDGGSLALLPAFQQAIGHVPSDAVARLYVSPRAWQAPLADWAKAAEGDGSRVGLRRLVVEALDATAAIAVALQLREGPTLHAYVAWNPETVPLNEVAAAPADGPDFLNSIPNGALAAFAGRIDVARTVGRLELAARLFGARDIEQMRAVLAGLMLGRDLDQEVIAQLGPAVCAYLVPSRDDSPEALAIEGALAIGLSDGAATGDKPSLTAALDNALRTLQSLAAVAQNAEHPEHPATVRTRQTEAGRITWLDGLRDCARGLAPAYLLDGEKLVMGTSPAVVEQFHVGSQRPLAEDRRFTAVQQAHFADADWLLWLDLEAQNRFLEAHGEQLAHQAAQRHGISIESARSKLRNYSDTVALGGVVFAAGRADGDGLRLVAGAIAQPASAP